MSKVIKPSEFNINKINIINDVKNLKNGMKVLNIHYDGNCEVLIQTPEITLPFDADCLDGRLQICMNLDKGYFKKKMEKMDKLVSDMGMKNSQQWLKKSGRPKKPAARKPAARKPVARLGRPVARKNKKKKNQPTAQELDEASNLLANFSSVPQRDIVVI